MTLTSSNLPSSTMAILQDQPLHYAGLSKKSQQCIERLLAHQAEVTDLYVMYAFGVYVQLLTKASVGVMCQKQNVPQCSHCFTKKGVS